MTALFDEVERVLYAAGARNSGALAQAVTEAVDSYITQTFVDCCACGALVDTREVSEGGSTNGAQTPDGEWVCSSACWDRGPVPA